MRTFHRRLRRAVTWTMAVALAMTALIGFAHTRPGRPLLGWLGRAARHAGVGTCPLGFDRAQTADEKDAARRRFDASHRGDRTTDVRPALGFDLDVTTRSDIQHWSAANGIRCAPPRARADLECRDVPADRLPSPPGSIDVRTLWLTFDRDDRLISVVAVRKDSRLDAIEDAFAAFENELATDGEPARVDGALGQLGAGVLRQASVESRRRNYYALGRATNMGDGYLLTEEMRSLAN